tara:strand:+ start:325 stop:540 length:216 start_codon:yes stop_codon:yes gene_type:complete
VALSLSVEKLEQQIGVINLKNKIMAKHKKFKPHMMYCKDGSVKEAKTFKDHLKFKGEGCGHKKPKDGGKKD